MQVEEPVGEIGVNLMKRQKRYDRHFFSATSRLPDKYRVLIILCDMLAKRLARRGVVMSGMLLGAVLSSCTASACVPMAVVSSTIKAASRLAAGQGVAAVDSPTVAALQSGVIMMMFVTKIKSVLAVVLIASLVVLGAGVAGIGLFNGSAVVAQSDGKNVEDKKGEAKPSVKEDESDKENTLAVVKAATARVGFPPEGHPVLPALSTEVRGHVCNEIASSAPIRVAYEKLNVGKRRNVDWLEGVAKLENQRAVWCLQSCLCHPSQDVQIHALRSLERLKDKRAVPFLILYAEYMAPQIDGSENATIHGVIHKSVAHTLSVLTGVEVILNGQDEVGLKKGIKRWRKWLVLQDE